VYKRQLEARVEAARRLAGQGSTSVSEGSARSNGSVTDAATRQEYLRLKTTLDQLNQAGSREQLKAQVQVLLPDASFAKLDEMEVAVRAEIAGLTSELGPEHSQVKALQAKLDSITKSLDERIAGAIKAAEIKLAALKQIVIAQSGSTSKMIASLDPATRARQKELLEQEIALVEGQLKETRRKVDAGVVPVSEPVGKERELLNLRRKLITLDESPEAIKRQRELIDQELALVRQLVESTKLRVENGQASRNDLVELERQMLQLMGEQLDLRSAGPGNRRQ
jgi:hypothetical protein